MKLLIHNLVYLNIHHCQPQDFRITKGGKSANKASHHIHSAGYLAHHLEAVL